MAHFYFNDKLGLLELTNSTEFTMNKNFKINIYDFTDNFALAKQDENFQIPLKIEPEFDRRLSKYHILR